MNWKEHWARAVPFDAYVAAAEKNKELWSAVYRLARVPEELVERARALPERHLLVIAEDWCGDAVNTVPVVARLVDGVPQIDLRILARDANLDIMDAHLTNGTRSIPVVITLDEHYDELGWWGPRPSVLQEWFLTTGKEMPKEQRYPAIRAWYARDHGLSTLREIVEGMESGQRPQIVGDGRTGERR